VVHGDLKGVGELHKISFTASLIGDAQPNILIDNSGNAVLCDFGLASITADADSAHASTVNSVGSIRWMAPERLSIFDGNSAPEPHSIRVTKESDMYSLAMVVIEVRSPPRQPTLNLTPRHGPP
jgi:serine/threonine protein kinase